MRKGLFILVLNLISILIFSDCSKENPIEAKREELTSVIDVDSNVYRVIRIGDQIWMAENLKVIHYRNGDAIEYVTNAASWSSYLVGAYCTYDNRENIPYGCLYNWYAVSDSRGLAPEGWHVASDAEWKILEMNLGMSQSEADRSGWRGNGVASKLKESGTTHWRAPNSDANNQSGFTALPGGYRYSEGDYLDGGYSAKFWTSTKQAYINVAYQRVLYSDSTKVLRGCPPKQDGCSIRCIKD
jgi:uncharacterized protein (TIGR02145 family)